MKSSNKKKKIPNLNEIPLIRGLPKELFAQIKSNAKINNYKKGDIISYEGKMCGRILFVRSGRIKISCAAPNGKEQILEVLGPGDTCACNTGQAAWQCSSSSQALTDCSVWILPRRYFMQYIHSNSKFAHSLNEVFAERLRKLSSLIRDVSLDGPQKRLAKFLVDMAQSDSSRQEDGLTYLDFTHEEISQRLGFVRETVTRHLQQFKRRGLIDIKPRRLIIFDEVGLKNICS